MLFELRYRREVAFVPAVSSEGLDPLTWFLVGLPICANESSLSTAKERDRSFGGREYSAKNRLEITLERYSRAFSRNESGREYGYSSAADLV